MMRTDPVIKDAIQHLIEISGDMQVQELARMRDKAEHEWASMMGDAEDKGRAAGEAKGEAIAKERILMSLLGQGTTASLPDMAPLPIW